MSFFLQLNIKEDILKNVGNQTVECAVTSIVWKKKNNTSEVNGFGQLFGYRHSSKYLLLCSTEERNFFFFKQNFYFGVKYTFKSVS